VEKEIFAAFEMIHSLNVIHSDVRTANIMIAENRNKVWIIDFDYGEIIEDQRDRECLISAEMEAIWKMLRDVRKGAASSGCFSPTENDISTVAISSLEGCWEIDKRN